jgi:hypothetical protein
MPPGQSIWVGSRQLAASGDSDNTKRHELDVPDIEPCAVQTPCGGDNSVVIANWNPLLLSKYAFAVPVDVIVHGCCPEITGTKTVSPTETTSFVPSQNVL